MTSRFLIDGDRDVILCGVISLLRNLGGIPFPPLMDAGGRRNVLKEVHTAISDKNTEQADGFRFFAMDEVGDAEAVSLVERGLADADFIAEREGRGLFISGDASRSIMVNGENHVVIRALSAGSDLPKAFERADWLDTVLDKSLHFAFDPRLGYLTRNPAHLGTGMIASFLLHLPALADSGAVSRLSSNLLRIGMSLQNVREPDPAAGGKVYSLINRMTMGLSEQDAVENLGGIAKQIVSQEREAREEYLNGPSAALSVKEAVRELQTAEGLTYDGFLDRIALVRLGIAARFVSGASLDAVDRLMREVQPATLSLERGGNLTKEENAVARAAVVRKALASLTADGEG